MIDHFDALAPLYDRLIGPPDLARLRALLDLPTTGWVLDAGGGTGRIAAQLRSLAGNLLLLDRSQPMLRQAQARACARSRAMSRAYRSPTSSSTASSLSMRCITSPINGRRSASC
jgi:ubiquinone/menaquinone biosynthesis C-methylase UbiE